MPHQNQYRKTVKYTEETDDKLQKLADQAGCTKRDFFIQMVEYFYRTKKDPKDINDELLKKTLAKNHNAAGTRLRNTMQQLKTIAQEVRTAVTAKKNAK
jgi:Fe2+ transport system protein B